VVEISSAGRTLVPRQWEPVLASSQDSDAVQHRLAAEGQSGRDTARRVVRVFGEVPLDGGTKLVPALGASTEPPSV
jgi:hypothetical protein